MHATHNLEENVTRSEGLSLLLLPRRDTTLRHGGTHRGHGELGEGMAGGRDVESCRARADVNSCVIAIPLAYVRLAMTLRARAEAMVEEEDDSEYWLSWQKSRTRERSRWGA